MVAKFSPLKQNLPLLLHAVLWFFVDLNTRPWRTHTGVRDALEFQLLAVDGDNHVCDKLGACIRTGAVDDPTPAAVFHTPDLTYNLRHPTLHHVIVHRIRAQRHIDCVAQIHSAVVPVVPSTWCHQGPLRRHRSAISRRSMPPPLVSCTFQRMGFGYHGKHNDKYNDTCQNRCLRDTSATPGCTHVLVRNVHRFNNNNTDGCCRGNNSVSHKCCRDCNADEMFRTHMSKATFIKRVQVTSYDQREREWN